MNTRCSVNKLALLLEYSYIIQTDPITLDFMEIVVGQKNLQPVKLLEKQHTCSVKYSVNVQRNSHETC